MNKLRTLSRSARKNLHQAKRVAQRFNRASCALPHLLFVAFEEGTLAGLLAEERRSLFQAELEKESKRGGERLPGRTIPLESCIKDILLQLRKIDADAATVEWHEIVCAAIDYRPNPLAPLLIDCGIAGQRPKPAPKVLARGKGKHKASDFFVDLTQLALEGKLGKMVGREQELATLERNLLRKMSNNSVLVGPPNCGKTKIVEGFAQRMIDGAVAKKLQGYRVLQLDLGLLVAGTRYRGDFEDRLNSVIEEWKKPPHKIVFIDEIHQLLGLGKAEGTMDGSNLLKPALARGELRCIGATTIDEYRLFEQDQALQRRFRKIDVPDMERGATLELLTQVAPEFEEHHRIRYGNEVLEQIARLAPRAWPEGHSPGREVDLLDEVGAFVAPRHETETQVRIEDVGTVVSQQIGIAAGGSRLTQRDQIVARLRQGVVGQDEAIEHIKRWLPSVLIDAKADSGPRAVLFLRGPDGVGKAFTARLLAEALLGPGGLVHVNLAHHVDESARERLIGGRFDDRGALTEPLRRRPGSLVLFENIELAHPRVVPLILEILQRGAIQDGHERVISFRSAILVATCDVTPSSDGKLRPGVDARLADRLGPAIAFQAIPAVSFDELVLRAVSDTFRSCVAAESRSGAVVVVATEIRDDGTHLRAESPRGMWQLHLAPRVMQELREKCAGRASLIAAVVEREIHAALGDVLLAPVLPGEIHLE